MKAMIFLVLNRRGVDRMTKNKPSLARDEIAIGAHHYFTVAAGLRALPQGASDG